MVVKKEVRKKRVPLGVMTSKLTIPDGLVPNGMVPRVVNDDGNRLQLAIAGGYQFVKPVPGLKWGDSAKDSNSDIGGKMSTVVGQDKSGSPMRGYLMMIRKDYFEEDQAQKQGKVDVIDQAIKTPGFKAGEKGLDNSMAYGSMKYKA